MTFLLALVLQEQGVDALAEALRKKLEAAATLRVATRMVNRSPQPQGTFRSTSSTRMKGKTLWRCEFTMTEGGEPAWRRTEARSDGLRIRVDAPQALALEAMKAEDVGASLLEEFSRGVPTPVFWPVPDGGPPKREVVGPRDGGRDAAGGRALRILVYEVRTRWNPQDEEGHAETIRFFVDPRALEPVRVEGRSDWADWTLEYTAFALDEPMDDALFALSTPRDRDRARAGHASRAAELFARFTGRRPRSLDELVRRPADLPPETWFPEGGFSLDGRAPEATLKDGAVVSGDYSVPLERPSGRAVAAPTERLRQHYAARVRLQLLASAVRARRELEGDFPRKAADLAAWLPGGALPADPWGQPYRLITERDGARLQVQDPKARRLSLKDLTPDERAALEAGARPRLAEEERKAIDVLLDRAVDDDLEAREEARKGLRERGAAALPALEARLLKPRDADAARWLAEAKAELPQGPPAWTAELAPLAVSVRRSPPGPTADMSTNERRASASLKTIASAQADFRGNDRDGNKIQDFWAGDIAGLYALKADGERIKLIELSVAAADAAPLEIPGALAPLDNRGPRGGYLFQAMDRDASAEPPEDYRQDTQGVRKLGKVFHHAKFGACCFPAEYGTSGLRTFILNEGNTIFWKDTNGEPVLEWPSDAELRAEWKRLD